MLGSTARMAWRNLGRNGRRTGLTLGAIAVAQTSVLLMDGMLNGYAEQMFDTLTGPLFGHVQVHAPGWREDRAPDLAIDDLDARLRALRALPGVETAFARAYAPALAARDVDGQAVLILGIDLAAEAERGGLLEGIDPEAIAGEVPALVGSGLARETGIQVGDELAVMGPGADGSLANDLVRVTGILDTPMDEIDRNGIVMPLATVQTIFALPDQAHEITVRGSDPEAAAALAARIAALEGFEDLETLDWRALAPELAQSLGMLGVFSVVLLMIVFLAAAAGVANTMLMSTFERRREFGVLLSLGTTPMRLVRMVLAEAILLGLLGVAIGTAIGGGLVLYWSRTGMDILLGGGGDAQDLAVFGVGIDPYVYPFLTAADLAPGVVGIVVVSVLAALLPAIGTARLEPMQAVRS